MSTSAFASSANKLSISRNRNLNPAKSDNCDGNNNLLCLGVHRRREINRAKVRSLSLRAGSSSSSSSAKAEAIVSAPSRSNAANESADGGKKCPRGKEGGFDVHKFGGTCVGSSERISGVCDLLIKNSKEKQTFAVVSAMGVITKTEPKVTDCLINATAMAAGRDLKWKDEVEKLRKKHADTANDLLSTNVQEYEEYMRVFTDELQDLSAMLKAISIAGCSTDTFGDFVVGHGELWTARLTAAAIRCKGAKAVWIDAREVLVVTEADDGGVDVDYEKSNEKMDKWYETVSQSRGIDKDTIIVCTGFIASTPDGFPTTLKRNGSDYSATIFGALLIADAITIWTDVDGVYSSDPRRVRDAVCLARLSYNEAWELAYFGANVLHPRTTLPAMKYSIPITIRNYFNLSAPGTLIAARCEIPASDTSEKGTRNVGKVISTAGELIKGITTIDGVCLVNVEGTGLVGVPGFAAAVFTTVKDANCNVVMISQASSEHSICFAVRQNEADRCTKALNIRFEKAIAAGRVARVSALPNCSILSAVGQNMANVPGVSAMLFTALASAAVNVIAISQGASEYNITVVIKKSDSIKAVNAVHSRFYASKTPLAVGIVGPGLVGKTLLRQMNEQKKTLLDKFGVDLRVVAIAGGSKMFLSDVGNIDLNDWESKYANENVPADFEKFTNHVEESNSPNQVIIDCSASGDVALQYKGWLSRGIHVVTPNKKANSGPFAYYQSLRNIQRDSYTHYFYEATVGAGLPIISTVKSMEDAGDDIKMIQGIFSGTLSYIFNTLTPEKKFSDVVAEAKKNGYTEPDPRDDLSGVDVARKVTILARECGLDLELSDIPIESLVPEPLRDIKSVDEFMQKLPEYDHLIAEKMASANAKNMKLCFVGVVDVENKKGSVQLKEYPKEHPFAQLKGSDNIISYVSKRYTEAGPLVVRGPGAGAEVTAGGVFADVLRVCAHLGAPS